MRRRLRQLRKRLQNYRRIFRTWRIQSRCHKCGLLGFFEYREGVFNSKAGPPLTELKVTHRDRAEWGLKQARSRGEIRREYDLRVWNDLGLANWIKGGVKCPHDMDHAARSTFLIIDSNLSRGMAEDNPGVLISVHDDPDYPGIGGKPVAKSTTYLFGLVRPHQCPYFKRHRPGKTPKDHADLTKGRLTGWLRDNSNAIRAGAAVIAAVVAILAWLG